MNTSTVAKKETVRAAINEKKFFEMQGQLYKSSFSFLGELMQNARRAGSTAVWFHLDKDKAQLICRDDGCGVEEFQNLVQLATSGWTDEKVQLTDKPFGMGLFSLFYACESVTVRSRGKMLVITRDDVIQRREIEVHADKDKVAKGTVIIMDGLAPKLLEDDRYHSTGTPELFKVELSCELRDRAIGFEIPVHLNEVTLDRPFARCNLKGEASKVGWVSIPGIHEGDTLSATPCNQVGYFLQGLPIGGAAPKFGYGTRTVVHLDSEQFVPVMPDRAVLQDESVQLQKVQACIKEITQRFLCEQKIALPAAEFVCKYFDHIHNAGLAHILNDVPVIPAREMRVLSEINYSSSETWASPHRPHSAVISRQDILDGHVKLWRYAPNNAVDSEFAVAILKVMERNQIGTLNSENNFDMGHWIHQCTLDASEFMVEVTPGKELSRGDQVNPCRADSCEVRMVEDFTIRITSRVDPEFSHVEVINDDWVLVPEEPTEDQDGEAHGSLIYYFTPNDVSGSAPWRALSDFEDEQDYREEWEDKAAADWKATIAAIKGQPLVNTIATALKKATECPDRRQANQFGIVRAVARWNNWNGRVGHVFNTVNPDAEFFASLAMQLESNLDGSMAERLQAAFTAVVRPGELDLDESVESNLVEAAGYRVLGGDAKNTWYVLLPGEKVANFEAEDHNYLGFFSSKEEAVADAFDAVLKQVEKVLGTTPEAFAELDFPAQWKQVKAAFEKTGE